MSYVDLILKYLSGDLSREEAASFEKEMESDPGLKESFEHFRAAEELTRVQLQKRDEEAFREKLREAMSQDIKAAGSGKPLSRFLWYIPPAAACVLAILLIVLPFGPGNEKVFSSYFHPAKDPVLLAINVDIRGETEPGIIQYRNGNFQQSMDLLETRISQDKDNKLVLLYYLLSAIELDRQQDVFEMMPESSAGKLDLLDQCIGWYTSLALIKSGMREAALLKLQPLSEQEGPYQSAAIRLEKILLK